MALSTDPVHSGAMLTLFLALAAAAQPAPQSAAQPAAQPTEQPSKIRDTLDRSGRIVAQPAHDVGAAKIVIPPALQSAQNNPYDLTGLKTCGQIKASIDSLTKVLGPDFAVGNNKKENRAGRLAEAGGKTIVNTLIPFRGLVREISGAAPAQRRLNDAIDAGFARRGFLRGVSLVRRCPGAAK
jgi:hypothetical protein